MKVWSPEFLSPKKLMKSVIFLLVLMAYVTPVRCATGGSPEKGLELLLDKAYLPADLDQEVFDALWTVWPEPLKAKAEQASVAERRQMAMERYGLLPHPSDPSRTVQYVVDSKGNWTMSCLACHQGQVAGEAVPGVPNTNYALETFTEEVRLVKIAQGKSFGHMDVGSLLLPLGTTSGTTNAVMFGVALMHHRDPALNIISRSPRFDLIHHDMDAPPWWHYRKRNTLYADGFAPQGSRMLMQFLLVRENGPEKFLEWEHDFEHVESWLESLQPPKWQWKIDEKLASEGETVFREHCGNCHGSYGERDEYPEAVIPIDEIGTDRVRFDALTDVERKALNESWFGHFGRDAASIGSRQKPEGYVAPPLDGVWASAPYFHNGSVPTLWHVLHPKNRPTIWSRSPVGYDTNKVGLEIREFSPAAFAEVVGDGMSSARRRQFFDTTIRGKSAGGHLYPEVLSRFEKNAVLEYLKTL
ncbi:MAG: cytochrome c [Planctomycetota bacterium]|nr:cytochrome c [Planctomycetota bacterium]